MLCLRYTCKDYIHTHKHNLLSLVGLQVCHLWYLCSLPWHRLQVFHSWVGSGTGGHLYPLKDRRPGGMLKAIAPTAMLSCGGTLQRSACTVLGGATNPCMCKKAFDQLCLCQSLLCTYAHWSSPPQICLSRCQQCG